MPELDVFHQSQQEALLTFVFEQTYSFPKIDNWKILTTALILQLWYFFWLLSSAFLSEKEPMASLLYIALHQLHGGGKFFLRTPLWLISCSLPRKEELLIWTTFLLLLLLHFWHMGWIEPGLSSPSCNTFLPWHTLLLQLEGRLWKWRPPPDYTS